MEWFFYILRHMPSWIIYEIDPSIFFCHFYLTWAAMYIHISLSISGFLIAMKKSSSIAGDGKKEI